MKIQNITRELKRTFSTLLAAVLVLQSAPIPGYSAPALSSTPWATLTPPRRVATLISSYAGKDPQSKETLPRVLLIQDLHFNYSVQKNIAKLLAFLGEKGAIGPKVAVEGAVGEVDNSLLTGVQNLKVREELADFLMQNGELTGSQYYSVMSGQPKLLQGVEDPAYFQANRDIFRLSFAKRQAAARQVAALRSRLETLIPALGSKPVLRLSRAQKRFEAGRLSMDRYWNILRSQGQKAGVPMPSVLEEYLTSSAERRNELLMSSALYSALDVYAVSIQAGLATSQDEQNLVRSLRELALAERALAQHATLEDIRHVVARLEPTASLIRLLASGSGLSVESDLAGIQDALRSCVDFYVAALMRNEPMLENTLALLRNPVSGDRSTGVSESHQSRYPVTPLPRYSDTVVLVVGGFHTDYFTRALKSRGVSYAVYTPQVDGSNGMEQGLYEGHLLGHRLTELEAVAALLRHGDARKGGARSASLLGIVPRLQSHSWLPAWVKLAVEERGFFDKGIIKKLYKMYDRVQFPGAIKVSPNNLTNAMYEEELLPGGPELRSVFSFFSLARNVIALQGGSTLDLPFNNFVILTKDDYWTTVRGEDPVHRSFSGGESGEILELVPTPNKRFPFEVVGHVQAIRADPGFKEDPFNFYLMVVLHELTHALRPDVTHEQLAAAGLARNYRVDMTPEEIIRAYADDAFLPELKQILSNGTLLASLRYAQLAHRVAREKGYKHIAQVTPADVDALSDYAWMMKKRLGEDMEPVGSSAYAPFDRQNISHQAVSEANLMEVDGRVIEEVFAGGAASRIRDLLDRMVKMGLLSTQQTKLLWNVPVRYFQRVLFAKYREMGMTEAQIKTIWHEFDESNILKSDWGHWGARAMLALNASIRRRARSLGVNETEALRKKTLLFHIPLPDLEGMAADFSNHDLYGLGEILFVTSHPGNYLTVDPRTDTVRIVPVDETIGEGDHRKGIGSIVYGHGPATMALVERNATYVLVPGMSRPVLLENESAADWLSRKYKNHNPVIRERRLNDLRILEPFQGDPEELAYFNQLRSDPQRPSYALFRTVLNPEQVVVHESQNHDQPGHTSLDVKRRLQSGGFSFRMRTRDESSYLASLEGGAAGGMTKEYIKKLKIEGRLPPENTLNQMQTLKDMHQWLGAVSRQGLGYFYGFHKDPSTEEPIYINGSLVIKPQLATNHLSLFAGLGANVLRATPRTDVEEINPGYLTDLKTEDALQNENGTKFSDLQDEDPLIRALAAIYGFDTSFLETTDVERIENELDAIVRSNPTPDMRAKAEMARAMVRSSRRKEGAGTGGALRPSSALIFLAGTSAALGVAAVAHAPAALLVFLGAYVMSALAHEVAVIATAVVKRDLKVLVSNKHVAWYQINDAEGNPLDEEDLSQVPVFARTFAHAQESARAITRSNSEITPRLIAPLTLAYAILDDAVAGLIQLIAMLASLVNRSPSPDVPLKAVLENNASKIGSLLMPAQAVALPPASSAWAKVWQGVQTGRQALWKNSHARQSAAELAARQALAAAA